MVMQMKRLQGFFSWFVVLSEVSHVFCCVLPSIFSVLTILVGMGILGATPVWMDGAHDAIHAWEVPIITMSGVVLALGWGLHAISKRIDCHDTGCGHEPCGPKKKNTAKILRIATFLFVINMLVYVSVHISQENQATPTHDAPVHEGHSH